MANNNYPKVPIPNGAKAYSDRVVFSFGHIFSETQDRLIQNRKIIGKPCDDGMMIPNNEYMKHFSDEFSSYTGMSALPDHVSIGLYAAVSTIVDKTGLKLCLEKVFGEKRTNSILDYAMYAIACHSNVSEHYSARMELIQVFSDKIYQDSYWSEFFKNRLKIKEIERFKELWVLKCVERGVTAGYTSWDGSNNDCDSKDVEEASQGKSKSGTSGDIYGYMYCVGQDGTPITYKVHDGATPDSVAIKNLIQFVRNLGVDIPGAILDRGFDDEKTLLELLTIVSDYVIKLKENTAGFKNAYNEKGKELRGFNSSLRIPQERLFGTTTKSVLFNNSALEEWVHLFYDYDNGGERAFALLDSIDGAVEDLQKKVSDYIDYEKKWDEEHSSEKSKKKKKDEKKKSFSISVPDKYKKYITIKGTTPQTTEIIKNDDVITAELCSKGMYAIATHKKMDAMNADILYKLRDIIEKLFDIIKTLLGFRRIRTETTDSLESRMLIAFVAAIIYTELSKASKTVAREKHSTNPKYDTTATIDQLLSISMILLTNGTYGLQHKSISKVAKIFKNLDAPNDVLEMVVEGINLKQQKEKQKQLKQKEKKAAKQKESAEKSGELSPEGKTEEEPVKNPRGRPPKPKEPGTEVPKNPRGRPPKPKEPGTEVPKNPRGRPPKPKEPGTEVPKNPRGRPPKPKEPGTEVPKNPRGRPPKVKEPENEEPKRPRGRPPKPKESESEEPKMP